MYVDTDLEPRVPLDDYVGKMDKPVAFAGVGGSMHFSQWMLVAKQPQHPIFATLIVNLGRYWELWHGSYYHQEVSIVSQPHTPTCSETCGV